MTKEFCDVCGKELFPGKDFSENYPVCFQYGTTHCFHNHMTTIIDQVCEACKKKLIIGFKKLIEDLKKEQK